MKNQLPITAVAVASAVALAMAIFPAPSQAQDSDASAPSVTAIEGAIASDEVSANDYLLGDLFGARGSLVQSGITPFLYYDSIFAGNVSGGLSTGEAFTGQVILTDLLGRRLSSDRLEVAFGEHTRQLDTRSLEPGMYLVNIVSANNLIYQQKIVVQ